MIPASCRVRRFVSELLPQVLLICRLFFRIKVGLEDGVSGKSGDNDIRVMLQHQDKLCHHGIAGGLIVDDEHLATGLVDIVSGRYLTRRELLRHVGLGLYCDEPPADTGEEVEAGRAVAGLHRHEHIRLSL